MSLKNIDPNDVDPLHEPTHVHHLKELTSDMRKNGWTGRALLVIRHAGGNQAWTGSHRIAAARAAGLQTIPCYVIPESKIRRHGADAVLGHVEDQERLEIIRKVKDETATLIMWTEGRED
jgi:ParB-like chromosome segregation protein Spo0J